MPYIIHKGKTIEVHTNPDTSYPKYPLSEIHHCAVHYDPKSGKNIEAERYGDNKDTGSWKASCK